MANHVFNRRGILGAMAIAPVVVAAPAVAHSGCPTFRAIMDHSDMARHRFNNLPEWVDNDPQALDAEMNRLVAASRRADNAKPTTWAEFVRLFEHMCDGGESAIDGENLERLLAHGRALLA